MDIAIIGTGKMAENLAKGWLKAGHRVVFGSRTPENKASLISALGVGARATTHAEAIGAADVVVLSLPYAEVEGFARQHSHALRSKAVIDITNPFSVTPPDGLSGAEVTTRAIGPGARVVAAFKTNFSSTITVPVDASGVQRDVFYCGNDVASKEVVHGLIADLGLRPVDCGALTAARALDPMVPLMIEMDRRLGGKGLTRRAHWKFMTP